MPRKIKKNLSPHIADHAAGLRAKGWKWSIIAVAFAAWFAVLGWPLQWWKWLMIAGFLFVFLSVSIGMIQDANRLEAPNPGDEDGA